MTLSNHFNQNALKQQKTVKTEEDIRTGVRTDSYGNTKFVRAGKIQRMVWADGSKDSHGAEVKLKAKQQQALAEKERQREVARQAQARKPSSPQP